MKDSSEKNSQLIVLLTVLSFCVLGLGALYFAADNTVSLIVNIMSLPDSINFNKGAQYLWGAGRVLLFLVASIIYTHFLNSVINS